MSIAAKLCISNVAKLIKRHSLSDSMQTTTSLLSLSAKKYGVIAALTLSTAYSPASHSDSRILPEIFTGGSENTIFNDVEEVFSDRGIEDAKDFDLKNPQDMNPGIYWNPFEDDYMYFIGPNVDGRTLSGAIGDLIKSEIRSGGNAALAITSRNNSIVYLPDGNFLDGTHFEPLLDKYGAVFLEKLFLYHELAHTTDYGTRIRISDNENTMNDYYSEGFADIQALLTMRHISGMGDSEFVGLIVDYAEARYRESMGGEKLTYHNNYLPLMIFAKSYESNSGAYKAGSLYDIQDMALDTYYKVTKGTKYKEKISEILKEDLAKISISNIGGEAKISNLKQKINIVDSFGMSLKKAQDWFHDRYSISGLSCFPDVNDGSKLSAKHFQKIKT